MAKRIEQWEINRYWEIFSSLVPPNAPQPPKLNGDQAASVLKNSRLRDDQLERVWDISDIDNDGQLDFEEFCVAMRLVFDLVNGEYADVPRNLPDWLVPEGKAHLVQAGRAVQTGHQRAAGMDDDDDDDDDDDESGRLMDGFDWYMSPAQKHEYDDIYTNAKDAHGYVAFAALRDLYQSLSVPDTDVRSAWNLVNPAADQVIGRDAALAFLHVLRGRHDGYRLPRSVPASLRASFERHDIEYNVDRVRQQAARGLADESTPTGRKAKFGDAYLSRLGGGSRPRGTDFSSTPATADWEEVRLKKELRDLEDKIAQVETAAQKRGRRDDSKPALVRRELEQMLDYKRRELRDLEMGEDRAREQAGQGLGGARGEIETIKEQVDTLEAHLRKREGVLRELRAQVEQERRV